MIDIRKARGGYHTSTPGHSQQSQTQVRRQNTTHLRAITQMGCTPRFPTVQVTTTRTVVTSLDGYHPGKPDALQLPPVVVCPAANGWCILRFRRSADLDQLIRNAVDKPHRRWSRTDGAWRVRVNHVRLAVAALYQADVRVIDARRGAA